MDELNKLSTRTLMLSQFALDDLASAAECQDLSDVHAYVEKASERLHSLQETANKARKVA